MPGAALQLKLRKAGRLLGFFRLSEKELRSFVHLRMKAPFSFAKNHYIIKKKACIGIIQTDTSL